MSAETKNVLLYGQPQSGFTLELSKAPAVSRACNYDELCIAAKNEEKRLAELESNSSMKEASQDISLKIKVLVRDLGRMLTEPINFTSNNHVAMSVTVLTI